MNLKKYDNIVFYSKVNESITDNHHNELCDDAASNPRFQNFPTP